VTRTESADAPVSRRAEYADATRRAIVAAARELFAARGYVLTKVDDIAAAARVSPATVYAVGGGKQGLLYRLVEEWSTAPEVATSYLAVEGAATGYEVLDIVATTVRAMRDEWGDVMRIVLASAPVDVGAAERLDVATGRYREAMRIAARRLDRLDVLRGGLSVDDAVDVLWFYFGYAGYFTLTDDNGWSPDRAQAWLRDTAATELLAR
jgi:AcrR family transcriptional regulator